MVDVSAIALSGFNASAQRLAVSANNIANANSDGFKAQDVVQTSSPAGGVRADVVTRSPATVSVAAADGGTRELPNVSLEQEVVNSDIATYSAQANLKVLQTQKKLDQYLLDIQA